MAFWDSWYSTASGAVVSSGEFLSGLFVDLPSGTPGGSEGGPNWPEIDRVLSLPGNEGARQEVDEVLNRPTIAGPSLADTIRSNFPTLNSTVEGVTGFFQTTLTKVLLGLVVVVVGLVALNIFVSRVTR